VTILDRIFGWLLIVGGLLHAGGSWRVFHNDPSQLLWALSGSLAVAAGFGAVIGHLTDPRAVIHGVNAAVLAGLSLRTLMQAPRGAPPHNPRTGR